MSAPTAAIAVETDRDAWDAFVEPRADADLLQTWAWGEVVAPSGERPVRIIVRRGEAVVGVAGALVRRTSFGRSICYVPHGPVWDREADDAGAILAALVDGLRRTGREERAIVVKLDPRAVAGTDVRTVADALVALGLRRARHDLQARTTRLVDLGGNADDVPTRWGKTARARIRTAAEAGVVTEVLTTPDEIAIGELVALLSATAAAAGFRTHDRAYFDRLAATLAPAGRWCQVVARHEGRVVATVVTPRLGDRGYYLYGTLLRDPAVRELYPSYAALAAAMEALAASGVRSFDLWGVAEPDDPHADPSWSGFSEFKRHFRGEPLAHPGTYDLVVDPAWYRVRDAAERLRARRPR